MNSQGDNQDFANTTDPSLKYADPNGYPRISLHPMRFKLIQTNDYVYQLWEYNNNWRQIALNVPQDPDPALTWYGNAVGKWDGDTLVVDSVGYKDSTWLDARGPPHTQDLHLTERIHRAGENLAFDVTFEDPGAFMKPWTAGSALLGLFGRPLVGGSRQASVPEQECVPSETAKYNQLFANPAAGARP